MSKSTYWRDIVLFDSLDDALQNLIALEETTGGEPKWSPYHNAMVALFDLMDQLHSQLENASHNAYYRVRKGAVNE